MKKLIRSIGYCCKWYVVSRSSYFNYRKSLFIALPGISINIPYCKWNWTFDCMIQIYWLKWVTQFQIELEHQELRNLNVD